jgi:hypothetical protein
MQPRCRLVGHEGTFSVRTALRDIVTGPTDAGKLDYLQRDSYFAGCMRGKYDLGRFIDTVTASPLTHIGVHSDRRGGSAPRHDRRRIARVFGLFRPRRGGDRRRTSAAECTLICVRGTAINPGGFERYLT